MSGPRHRKRHLRIAGSVSALALLVLSSAVRADPVDVINAFRLDGCADVPAVGARVRHNEALDDVARELSVTNGLEQAFELIDYFVASATSFHVRGSSTDDDVRQILAGRYCSQINDARYTEIGYFGRGDETWIVLAVGRPSFEHLDAVAVAERVLELVNEARAAARMCGRDQYDAAPPVSLSAVLNEAALSHARDMAARGSIGHAGSDGSSSGERIRRAGYAWRSSGENIAAGQTDADAVVAAWLSSPRHCATLMRPVFTEMGVAYAEAPSNNPFIYWAQVFAVPVNNETGITGNH